MKAECDKASKDTSKHNKKQYRLGHHARNNKGCKRKWEKPGISCDMMKWQPSSQGRNSDKLRQSKMSLASLPILICQFTRIFSLHSCGWIKPNSIRIAPTDLFTISVSMATFQIQQREFWDLVLNFASATIWPYKIYLTFSLTDSFGMYRQSTSWCVTSIPLNDTQTMTMSPRRSMSATQLGNHHMLPQQWSKQWKGSKPPLQQWFIKLIINVSNQIYHGMSYDRFVFWKATEKLWSYLLTRI